MVAATTVRIWPTEPFDSVIESRYESHRSPQSKNAPLMSCSAVRQGNAMMIASVHGKSAVQYRTP